MRIIIAGSRDLGIEEVTLAMAQCQWPITTVISGGARGVDTAGEQWARGLGIAVQVIPADWKTFGKSAGYLRNVQMAESADALVAVWDGKSPGTRHMIDIARKRGLGVLVWLKEPVVEVHKTVEFVEFGTLTKK